MIEKIDKSIVLDFIKKSEVPVGRKAILDGTGYAGDFNYCMSTLMHTHDEIKKTGVGRSAVYSWSPKKAIYSEMKNPEGYSDSTAGKAIANIMRSGNNGKYPMRQHFGEVWACSNVMDDQEGYLIISAKAGTIICCNVYPTKKVFMRDGLTFKWVDNDGTHYSSVINLVNISEKKLDKKLYEIGKAEKDALKAIVSAVVDIPEPAEAIKIVEVEKEVPVEVEKIVEVPVEKIVEVEKPVEVEKIVEVHADEKDIELAVLRAKCELFERIIFFAQKLQAI